MPEAILGRPRSDDSRRELGAGWVWTTFARPPLPDGTETTRQVDLNYANPKLFLKVIEILLYYIEQGARGIRLDAIGYIWKKLGSTSLHEAEAHLLLEAMTTALRIAAPAVFSVAEVNEPQEEVLPYLGTPAHPEADLVYQFAHFPLAVHAILTGNARYYREWVRTLPAFHGRQFITLYGSHDGMGLKPVQSILPQEEVDRLVRVLQNEHGALPNYAYLPGGRRVVYELCATPWHLINNPHADEPFSLQLQRYLLVAGMGLMLRGMPAIYINGLLGSHNYLPPEGLDENRTINREQFDAPTLFRRLDDAQDPYRQVMDALMRLCRVRAGDPIFDPAGPPTEALPLNDDRILVLRIEDAGRQEALLGLFNVSPEEVTRPISEMAGRSDGWDVLEGRPVDFAGGLILPPYRFRWIRSRPASEIPPPDF